MIINLKAIRGYISQEYNKRILLEYGDFDSHEEFAANEGWLAALRAVSQKLAENTLSDDDAYQLDWHLKNGKANPCAYIDWSRLTPFLKEEADPLAVENFNMMGPISLKIRYEKCECGEKLRSDCHYDGDCMMER